jgi:hypothetical protein
MVKNIAGGTVDVRSGSAARALLASPTLPSCASAAGDGMQAMAETINAAMDSRRSFTADVPSISGTSFQRVFVEVDEPAWKRREKLEGSVS